jgi:transposase InsO family protein
MDQHTRRIIGFGIQKGSVDGINLCRMFNQATSGISKPTYLSSDNDPLFRYHRWQANLRIMDIQEIKSIPYVPQSHPFVERLIGTVRRECLDKILFWNERDLANKLEQFRVYYNENRAHSSLDGFAPEDFDEKKHQEAASLADFGWQKHCRGLFELPVSV